MKEAPKTLLADLIPSVEVIRRRMATLVAEQRLLKRLERLALHRDEEAQRLDKGVLEACGSSFEEGEE